MIKETVIEENEASQETKSTQNGVAARWTEELAQRGWTPIIDAFLLNYNKLGITTTQAMVVIQIMQHKRTSAAPYPAVERIAKRMGIDPPTIRHHLRQLEADGFLKRHPQKRKPNKYDFQGLFDKLEALPRPTKRYYIEE